MTPRERDPQVWAAAYAAMFVADFRAAVSALAGPDDDYEGRAIRCVNERRAARIADAAVMALHPDGTFTAINGVTFAVPTDEGPASERGG